MFFAEPFHCGTNFYLCYFKVNGNPIFAGLMAKVTEHWVIRHHSCDENLKLFNIYFYLNFHSLHYQFVVKPFDSSAFHSIPIT